MGHETYLLAPSAPGSQSTSDTAMKTMRHHGGRRDLKYYILRLTHFQMVNSPIFYNSFHSFNLHSFMLLIFLHDICLPVWRSPSLGRRVRWDYISFWLWLDSGHPKLSCILWWSFRSLWFSFVWDLEVFCSFRHQGSLQSCQYWHLKIFLYIFHISRIALHPFQGSRSPLRKYHLSKFWYLCKKIYLSVWPYIYCSLRSYHSNQDL